VVCWHATDSSHEHANARARDARPSNELFDLFSPISWADRVAQDELDCVLLLQRVCRSSESRCATANRRRAGETIDEERLDDLLKSIQAELVAVCEVQIRVGCPMRVGEALTHFESIIRAEKRKEARTVKFVVDYDGAMKDTLLKFKTPFRTRGGGSGRRFRGGPPRFSSTTSGPDPVGQQQQQQFNQGGFSQPQQHAQFQGSARQGSGRRWN
jgi:hypothetical protein